MKCLYRILHRPRARAAGEEVSSTQALTTTVIGDEREAEEMLKAFLASRDIERLQGLSGATPDDIESVVNQFGPGAVAPDLSITDILEGEVPANAAVLWVDGAHRDGVVFLLCGNESGAGDGEPVRLCIS